MGARGRARGAGQPLAHRGLLQSYAFALAGAAAAVTERATIGLGVVNPQLIQASPWRGLPPRLPGHPTFYPLLNEEYATQIARDWNANRDGGGYVTRFRVKAEFARWYEPQTVGAAVHKFNKHIVGEIEVIAEFHGTPTTDTAS